MNESNPNLDANRLFEAAEAVLVMHGGAPGPVARPRTRHPLLPSADAPLAPDDLAEATRFLERLGFLTPAPLDEQPGRTSHRDFH